jgi:hypothetical protein
MVGYNWWSVNDKLYYGPNTGGKIRGAKGVELHFEEEGINVFIGWFE